MSDMFDDFDADAARAERQNRMNPPEFAPGQSDDDDFFNDDLFGSDSSMDSGMGTQPSMMNPQVGGFNMNPMGDMNGMNGMGNQGQGGMNQQGSGISTEDKIFDAAAKGAKGALSFSKELVGSFKGLTPKFWSVWGSNTFVVSGICAGVGLVLTLFGVKSLGFNMLIGGILSAGTGGLVLMFNVEKAKECTSKYVDGDVTQQSQGQPALGDTSDFNNDFNSSDGDFDFGSDDDDGDFDFGSDDDDDEDFDFGSDDDSEEGSEDDFSNDDFFSTAEGSLSSEPAEAMSTEDALNSLVVPDMGIYTRQYLYEAFTKVLMNITPSFSKVELLNEDSNEFLFWNEKLREACEASGIKEESLPDLEKLEKNLFTFKLTFNRPIGLKADLVANEIATLYAYADGEFNSSVYAKADAIGKKCIITVFTGKSAMISVKDMYDNCKDFMLDTKNYMPVVIGVNHMGKVIKTDFKKIESVLITGMPRSGKSWFVQAILTQMCAFVPPSELNIYICDPKEGISDFKAFKLPHVKKFVSGDLNIVNTLRSVVKDLAPKRKKIIGDAGFVNIWDFKERNPTVHMPIIYVLIDEVVTLAERMEKEVKQEFQGLLVELISQLPALGIRAFLIPHVVKNDIIAKTATDLIPCRISVCGDAGHIESSTGTKPRDFPYKLSNKGDMAVRLPAVAPETMFIHGPALSDSNVKNNDLFDYLLKVWEKLEPDEVSNSVAAGYLSEEMNNKAVENLDLSDDILDDDFDVFSDNASVPARGVSSTGEIQTKREVAHHDEMHRASKPVVSEQPREVVQEQPRAAVQEQKKPAMQNETPRVTYTKPRVLSKPHVSGYASGADRMESAQAVRQQREQEEMELLQHSSRSASASSSYVQEAEEVHVDMSGYDADADFDFGNPDYSQNEINEAARNSDEPSSYSDKPLIGEEGTNFDSSDIEEDSFADDLGTFDDIF